MKALDTVADDATIELRVDHDVVYAVVPRGEDVPPRVSAACFAVIRGSAYTDACVRALLDRAPDPMDLFDLVRDRGTRNMKQAAFAVEHFPRLLRPCGVFVSDIREDWIPTLVAAAHEDVRCLMRFSKGRLTIDRGAAKGAWVDRDVGYPARSSWMRHRLFAAWVLKHVETKHVAVVGNPPDEYAALCFAEDGADSVWTDTTHESRVSPSQRHRVSTSQRRRVLPRQSRVSPRQSRVPVRTGPPPPQVVDVVLAWDPPSGDIDLHPDGIALVHGTAEGNLPFLRSLGMPVAVLVGGPGIGIATHNSRVINAAIADFGFVKI
jgi:hypothetical protein